MIEGYSKHIANLDQSGNLRSFSPLSRRDGCYIERNGTRLLNMTSNDYLGIAGNRELQQRFYDGATGDDFFQQLGLGAASSRLLTGDTPTTHLLEECICHEYCRPACLLFNSGYHANIGILPSLTGKRDLILSDKLNHASIHDGMRLSRATYKRFQHRDYSHLKDLLKKQRDKYEKVVIITESVFSMDGDEADLLELVSLKNEYNCMLYVDEAHGVGLYGEKGLGKAQEYGIINEVDLLVGTFGKAYASVGAYLLCRKEIYDFLVNTSRSLIFTTALPPVIINWNLFIFQHVLSMSEERRNLEKLSAMLRKELIAKGLQTDGSTNIVPVIIGDNQKTVLLAEKMQKAGYLIFAVRPPTVPEGTSRFRLSLTSDMTWQDICNLPQSIVNGMTEL